MRPRERQQEIELLVNRRGHVTVDDLAEKLTVSRETIRRDLASLQKKGRVRKCHGGARSVDAVPQQELTESPFAQRLVQNAPGKQAMAAMTERLFAPGDTLFIDTGSTTFAVAESLASIPSLLVITNSPRIASVICSRGNGKVFLIGGAYSAEVGENLGPLAIEQIEKFHTRHTVLTVGAIGPRGVMDFDLQEAEIARAMIARSEMITVFADHTKFDKQAVFEVAPLSSIARVVTDRRPGEAMCQALKEAGVDLLVADPAS
ncbi:DeoR/GlpR transcriptional regulator [Rhodobacterales bacterium]|nr:DeoR/GlpR transcriptional regulator [Rhodobacterales bacterium]